MKRAIALMLLLAALAAPLFSALPHYENQIIEKLSIDVIGDRGSSENYEKQVRARIQSTEGTRFSQADFDNDLKTLVTEYDYVEPRLESSDGRMHIRLKIWPKPEIRSINWCGNRCVDTATLQKELGISACSLFDRLAFNQAFQNLKKYYVENDYFEAQLDYRIAYIEESNQVDITINICEGRAGKIRRIFFCGFTDDEEKDLRDMMYTKEYSFLTSWFTKEGTYHKEAVQQDEFIILNYLQNKGYADAEVQLEVKESCKKGRIDIQITADKGPCYRFGAITFEGNALFDDSAISGCFCIREGGRYSPEEIRNTIDRITRLYGRKGYIDAIVDYEPKLEPENCAYAVHITIDEGEPFCVGLIKVFGNCATQTKVILHETLLVPGEQFNTDRLKRTEQRLMNIGYFKNVNVYAVKSDEENSCLGGCYRDVHIEVEEEGTGNVSAFAGLSSTEALFGGLSLTERNFNYKGLFSLWNEGPRALRGGGEFLHLTGSIGQKSRRYVISWTKPYFMDTQWTVGVDLERTNNRYISQDYEISAWSGSLNASYLCNAFLRFGWHYRVRDSSVTVDNKQAMNKELQRQAKNAGLVSASGISLLYDSTDSPCRPTSGFKSRLEAEYAGLGGEYNFASFAYLNTYYMPCGERGVFKLRGDMRFIQPIGNTREPNIPLDERLFLGGDSEIRGYRPYALGPKFEPSNDPEGGISMQLISAEYQRRLWERMDAFFYIDSGQLSKREWKIQRVQTAFGFGIRLQVFENGPPLTVGYGFPVNPKSNSEVKRLFLTIGGKF